MGNKSPSAKVEVLKWWEQVVPNHTRQGEGLAYDTDLITSCAFQMDEITYSSLNFNAQESKKPTYASPSPTATETVYSEVKKK